jgi:hypothetical protein
VIRSTAHERREALPAQAPDAPDEPQEARQDDRDPHAVSPVAEQAQEHAGDDRERMLGGIAVALEDRLVQIEDLAAPQQRVVRVVVRVRRIDEEPDRESHAEQHEGAERDGVGVHRAKAFQTVRGHVARG